MRCGGLLVTGGAFRRDDDWTMALGIGKGEGGEATGEERDQSPRSRPRRRGGLENKGGGGGRRGGVYYTSFDSGTRPANPVPRGSCVIFGESVPHPSSYFSPGRGTLSCLQ